MASVFSIACFLASLFLIVGLIYSLVSDVRQASKWHREWPPIDDDEFMARCPPGANRAIALGVRSIVSEQLGVDYDRVYPEQRFVEDLGCG